MPAKTQLWESEDAEINVLGLRTSRTILQLAYFLNSYGKFRFSKVPEDYTVDIRQGQTAHFVHFLYEEEHQRFFLVANHSLESETDSHQNLLFALPARYPLMPAYKKIDAWICWEEDGTSIEEVMSVLKKHLPDVQIEEFPLSKRKNNKRLAWLF